MSAPQTNESRRVAKHATHHARWWIWSNLVGLYLFVVGAAAATLLIGIFPSSDYEVAPFALPPDDAADSGQPSGPRLQGSLDTVRIKMIMRFPRLSWMGFDGGISPEQGLILLALLGGVVGSVLHALQSYAVYLGNRQFIASWGPWYLYRPLIGGILGLLLYFVIRAGLLGATDDSVSPYGVVTFGGMAGLFAKQAVDKLAEVFSTLFRTRETQTYQDSLDQSTRAPHIQNVTPKRLPLRATADPTTKLEIAGDHFGPGAQVLLDDQPVSAIVESSESVIAAVPSQMLPEDPRAVKVQVVNPTPTRVASKPYPVPTGQGQGQDQNPNPSVSDRKEET